MRRFRLAPTVTFRKKSLGLSLVTVALGLTLQPANEACAQSRFSSSRLSRNSSQKSEAKPAASQAEEATIKLNFYSKTWDQVLQEVAQSTDAVLVADKIPRGRYSRQDFRNYSQSEAVRILNGELEKQDFRIIQKGKYLVVLNLPAARPEYSRLQIESPEQAPAGTSLGTARVQDNQRSTQRPASSFAQRPPNTPANQFQQTPRQRAFERSSVTINPSQPTNGRDASQNYQPRTQRARPGAIRQLNYENSGEGGAFAPEQEPQKTVRQLFEPRARTARSLAATLYGAFRERAKIVEEGPDGLPAMRVYSPEDKANPDKPASIVFTVAADVEANEILVEGPADQVARVVRLLERLDVAPAANGESTRLVPTQTSAGDIAANLRPAVNRMVAQNDGGPMPPTNGGGEDPGDDSLPDLVGGIRGNVDVEAMDELGVLILKGNTSDVDAVMEIIRQIEELSARSAPDIHLRLLENVDSVALAELLTEVYDELNQARGRTQTQSPQIGIIAVGRPNAVLILSPEDDLESIETLIDELDQPVPNHATFVVVKVKNGIASSISDIIEETWQERFGLENRPRLSADARTNSVVAIGTKADLQEVVALIEQLDTQESGAVSEVQVVELRHSVAEELAGTVNEIMQSILNPPQLGQGQLGQAFLGFGGNSSQALREVRSAVLEYLVGEGEEARKIRSGILADIRLTADSRSNTIVVASPRESMELVLALIARLDRPASSVASIKHFSLKNADAESTRLLLDELFGAETTGTNDVGIQLAGAEKASSVIPLKFSVDARTNSIVAVGTAEALQVVEALIFRLDDSDIRQRQTTIIRLKNAPAADIATAIDSFLGSQIELLANQDDLISAFELVEREVIVQAETYTNSLLISATSRYFDQIRDMVLTLDKELPQVVIQAMLVEVVLEDADEFGIELGLQDSLLFSRGLGGGGMGAPGFNFNSNGLPNTNAASQGNLAGQALSSFGVTRSSLAQGFGGLVLSAGSESVSILLRALARNREIEILSRPQIRTLDNRPALIRMVRELQIINGFNTNTNTGALNPILGEDEAGLILSVTPTISPDGDILMSLTAEKSAFIAGAGAALSFNDDGSVATRGTAKDLTQAETTVVVADEQTIVLGGLITKTVDKETRKVPWLGDLPVVGHGFRFDSESTRRTELLIFLTPRIVKGHSGNELIKQVESQRLHYCEADAEEIHGPIYGIPASARPSAFEPSTFRMAPTVPMNESSQLPLPLPAPGEEEEFPMTSQKAVNSRTKNPFAKSSFDRVRQVGFTQPDSRSLKRAEPAEKPRSSFLNFGRSLKRKE